MRYEGVVDIFQTVKMLRTQRPAMVQTEVRRSSLLPQHLTFYLTEGEKTYAYKLHIVDNKSCQ